MWAGDVGGVPKAFITFITISGTPYVLWYDWQIISAADFDAEYLYRARCAVSAALRDPTNTWVWGGEYGFDGLCASPSLKASPSSAEP